MNKKSEKNKIETYKEIIVDPLSCHKRFPEVTLVEKVIVDPVNNRKCEVLVKYDMKGLNFFFDHEIDHLPGMLEVCTVRQAALAAGHLAFNVPSTFEAVLGFMNIELDNFGELDTETIARIEILHEKRTDKRIEIVMNVYLMQGNCSLIRVKGSLLAFHPDFFKKKIRFRKIPLDSILLSKKVEKKRYDIVEIFVSVEKQQWEIVQKEIVNNMKSHKASKNTMIPLYVNFDEDDFEIRACFVFSNPQDVEKYILDKIRSIKGVLATKARLTLNGKIFPDGVKTLVEDKKYYSAHAFLKVRPSMDKQTWKALSSLENKKSAFPTWIFRDFYEYDRDISLRVVGNDKQAVENYIKDEIEPIEGIEKCQVRFMKEFIKIMPKEELLDIAKQWF